MPIKTIDSSVSTNIDVSYLRFLVIMNFNLFFMTKLDILIIMEIDSLINVNHINRVQCYHEKLSK